MRAIFVVLLLSAPVHARVLIPFLPFESTPGRQIAAESPLQLVLLIGRQFDEWPNDGDWWSMPIEPVNQTIRIDPSVKDMSGHPFAWFDNRDGRSGSFRASVFVHDGAPLNPELLAGSAYSALGLPGESITRAWDSIRDLEIPPSLPLEMLIDVRKYTQIPAIDIKVAIVDGHVALSGVIYREVPEPSSLMLFAVTVVFLQIRRRLSSPLPKTDVIPMHDTLCQYPHERLH